MTKPAYVETLASLFWPPSAAAWGSAVFHDAVAADDLLAERALQHYRAFVGAAWERFGEAAWMSGWSRVLERDGPGDVAAALLQSDTASVRSSADMLLSVPEDAESRIAAVRDAFNDPAVSRLEVHTTGDGAALSGLMIAGRRSNGEATFLAFLMD